MNAKHIEAIIKHASFVVRSTGNPPLISDGHFLVEAPDGMDISAHKEGGKRVDALWESCSHSDGRLLEIGGVCRVGIYTARTIGDRLIQEIYFRSVGPAQWTAIKHNGDECLIAKDDGVLIGVVMPIKQFADEATLVAEELTDQRVFAPIACEANGWYLQDGPDIENLLHDVEEKLNDAQARVERLEDELVDARAERDAAERDRSSLRKLLKAKEATK